MKTLEYQVSFTTPAFLGNAAQEAQWRTPPFKALIRQWWRIVRAPKVGYDVNRLRADEAALFGSANPRTGFSRSLVTLRLVDGWKSGSFSNDKWPRGAMRSISIAQRQVRADVYLGFGPIVPASRKQGRAEPVVARDSIAPTVQTNVLRLRFDALASEDQVAEVTMALRLVAWFGALGSRARNGWGSLALTNPDTSPVPHTISDIAYVCRPVRDALSRLSDWPHAIGLTGEVPTVWIGPKSGERMDAWTDAVNFLATVRRDIRSTAKDFGRGQDISANQIIAYPVTKSGNHVWGDKERIANSLRFKVAKVDNRAVPIAVHLPCAVPRPLFDRLSPSDQSWVESNQSDIWAKVYETLDSLMSRMSSP
ncbi:MAG: hypothetical protein U1F52_21720 [Burkholderiales bacterium]